jgi:hypothetical protein
MHLLLLVFSHDVLNPPTSSANESATSSANILLYFQGKVGVSEVCIMGLNVNQGQEIKLRLRTDNLKGFRNHLSVMKVLYHELAHNVHGPHDDNFFKLMREIEKEACTYRDKYNSAEKLGGTHQIQDDWDETSSAKGGKLGGDKRYSALD